MLQVNQTATSCFIDLRTSLYEQSSYQNILEETFFPVSVTVQRQCILKLVIVVLALCVCVLVTLMVDFFFSFFSYCIVSLVTCAVFVVIVQMCMEKTSRMACFLLLFVFPRQYSKVLRFVLRAAFFVCGFHCVKVKGQSAAADVAPIVCVAPHSSPFDALVFLLGCSLGSGVSREENTKICLLGSMYCY